MLQHTANSTAEKVRLSRPETHDALPALPEGVVAPDDLSGLE